LEVERLRSSNPQVTTGVPAVAQVFQACGLSAEPTASGLLLQEETTAVDARYLARRASVSPARCRGKDQLSRHNPTTAARVDVLVAQVVTGYGAVTQLRTQRVVTGGALEHVLRAVGSTVDVNQP